MKTLKRKQALEARMADKPPPICQGCGTKENVTHAGYTGSKHPVPICARCALVARRGQ